LENGHDLTAREIALILFKCGHIPLPARQAVAPRLTEMAAAGLVEVTGKIMDHATRRKVATYRRAK
jgi:hypothetical protein